MNAAKNMFTALACVLLLCVGTMGCSTTQVMRANASCKGCMVGQTRAPASRHYTRAVYASIAGMRALGRHEHAKAATLFESSLSQTSILLSKHPDSKQARHVRQHHALAGIDLQDVRLVLLKEMRRRERLNTLDALILYWWMGAPEPNVDVALNMAEHHTQNGLFHDAQRWLVLINDREGLSDVQHTRRAQLQSTMRRQLVPEILKITGCALSPGLCGLEDFLGRHRVWSGKKTSRDHVLYAWCQGGDVQIRQLLKAKHLFAAGVCALNLKASPQRAFYTSKVLRLMRAQSPKTTHSFLFVMGYTFLAWLQDEERVWTSTFAAVVSGDTYKAQRAWVQAVTMPMSNPSYRADASTLLTQLATHALVPPTQPVSTQLSGLDELDDTRRRALARALVEPVDKWLKESKPDDTWHRPTLSSMLRLYQVMRRPALAWNLLRDALRHESWAPDVSTTLKVLDAQGLDALTHAPKIYGLLNSASDVLTVGNHTLNVLWKTPSGDHLRSKENDGDTDKDYNAQKAVASSLVAHTLRMIRAVAPFEDAPQWSHQVQLLGVSYALAFSMRVMRRMATKDIKQLFERTGELLNHPEHDPKVVRQQSKALQDSYARNMWRVHRALQRPPAVHPMYVDSTLIQGMETLPKLQKRARALSRRSAPWLDVSQPAAMKVANQIHDMLLAQHIDASAQRVFERPERMLKALLNAWSKNPSGHKLLARSLNILHTQAQKTPRKARGLRTHALNLLHKQTRLSRRDAVHLMRTVKLSERDRARVLAQWRVRQSVKGLDNPEILAWLHVPQDQPLTGQYRTSDLTHMLTLEPQWRARISRVEDVASPGEQQAASVMLRKHKMLRMCEVLHDLYEPQEPSLEASLDAHREAAAVRCLGLYALEPADLRKSQIVGGFDLIMSIESEARRARTLSRVYGTPYWQTSFALRYMYKRLETVAKEAPIARVMKMPD